MNIEYRNLIAQVPAPYDEIGETDSIFISPSLSGDVYSGPIETAEARLAIGALSNLVWSIVKAGDISNRARSWRNYKVGANALMVNIDQAKIGLVSGCNIKTSSGDSELNIHAEQMAISKGRRAGLDKVIGIAVIADPNDSDANPDHRHTLHPCNRCVRMFQEIPEVTNQTLILGSNYDNTVCELYSFGELINPSETPLIEEPFSLESEAALSYYDHYIVPFLLPKIFALFNQEMR